MSAVNFFLAQLSAGQVATGQNGSGIAGESGALNSGKAAFDFMQLLMGQSIAESNTPSGGMPDQGDKDKVADILTQIQLRKPGADITALVEQLDALKQQIIVKQSALGNEAESAKLIDLQDLIDTLKAHLLSNQENGSDDVPIAALLLTGLSPSDIANLRTRVQELEAKLGRELTIEDIIAGVGGITTENDKKTDFPTLPIIKEVENKGARADKSNTSKDTSIEVGATQNKITISEADIATTDATENEDNIEYAVLGAFVQLLTPFQSQATIPHYEGMSARDIINTRIAKLQAVASIGQGVKSGVNAPGLETAKNALQNGNNPLTSGSGNFFSLEDGFFVGDDGMLFIDGEPTGINMNSGLPFSNVNQAAHTITQTTQQASHPHPASEMVSARLLQAARDSKNQTMLLQLEPADLGKVEVRLEFGKDKVLKAVMTVEKPETFLMLQRDAHALERSLQDSGLELDGGSIDMQLAEDGNAFTQDNDGKGNGQGYGGNQGQAGGEGELIDDTVIASTMTWQVNPESGHVHYNIMA